MAEIRVSPVRESISLPGKSSSEKIVRYQKDGRDVIAKTGSIGFDGRDGVTVLKHEAVLFGKLADSGVTPKVEGFKVYPDGKKARLLLEAPKGQPLNGEGVHAYRDNPQRVVTTSAEVLCKLNQDGIYLPAVTGNEFFVNEGGLVSGVIDLSTASEAAKDSPEKTREILEAASKDDLGLRIALAKGVSPESYASLLAASQVYSWADSMAKGVLGPDFSWERGEAPTPPYTGRDLADYSFARSWIVAEAEAVVKRDYQILVVGGGQWPGGENGYWEQHGGNIISSKSLEAMKGGIFKISAIMKNVNLKAGVRDVISRALSPNINERPSLDELAPFWTDPNTKPERGSLSKPIKDIKERLGGTAETVNPDLLDPATLAEWERQKPERHGLAGIIINEAFKKTLAQTPDRGPYGLLTSIPVDPVQRYGDEKIEVRQSYNKADLEKQGIKRLPTTMIGTDLRTTVREDLKTVVQTIAALPGGDYLRRVYDRLNSMVKLRWQDGQSFLSEDPKEWTYDFIAPGADTLDSIMGGVVEAIRQVYYRENQSFPANKELSETAKNSYPILAKLAGMHLMKFVGTVNSIAEDESNSVDPVVYPHFDSNEGIFNPDVFEFNKGKDNKISLVFKKDAWDKAQEEAQKAFSLSADNSVETVCPALAPRSEIEGQNHTSRGDDYSTVVRGIWNLYCDTVAKI